MFFLKSLAFASRIIILAQSHRLSARRWPKSLKARTKFYKNISRIKYLYWETLIVVWLPFRRRKCLFRFITWRREIAATTKPFRKKKTDILLMPLQHTTSPIPPGVVKICFAREKILKAS